jgi:hypothetical protein
MNRELLSVMAFPLAIGETNFAITDGISRNAK